MENRILLKNNYSNLQKELVRKSVHMTVAFVPLLANINKDFTIVLLIFGVTFYLGIEFLRSRGVVLFRVLSSISEIASRERDKGMTLGPVSLGVGALLALLFFAPVPAACGIYALAFGDGLSSLTGKLWGRVKIPFTNGKSFVGSFTCFVMILSTSYGVTGSLSKSLLAATGGTIAEMIPAKDIDNFIIPFTVALLITI